MFKQALIDTLNREFRDTEFTQFAVMVHAVSVYGESDIKTRPSREEVYRIWGDGFRQLLEAGAIVVARKTPLSEIYELTEKVMLTEAAYQATHTDFRGIWETERTDLVNWSEIRDRYIGKRTLYEGGALHVEGMSLVILDDD